MINGIHAAAAHHSHSATKGSNAGTHATKGTSGHFDLAAALEGAQQEQSGTEAHAVPTPKQDQPAPKPPTELDGLKPETKTDPATIDPRLQLLKLPDPIATLLARAKSTSVQLLQSRLQPTPRKPSAGPVLADPSKATTDPQLPLVFSTPLPLPSTGPKQAENLSTTGTGGVAPAGKEEQALAQVQAGSLAFSASIQPHSGASSETLPALERKADAALGLQQDSDPLQVTSNLVESSSSAAGLVLSDYKHSGVSAAAIGSGKINPSTAATVQEVEAPATAAAATQPLRDLVLHIPGSQGVEVRVSERGGEVKVDVRSVDPAFNQELRGNLHELVDGLDRKGFAAQTSHALTETVASTGQTSSAASHDQQRNGGDAPGDRQQNQQQRQQPESRNEGHSSKSREAAWDELFQSRLN